jgi:hypothetical protein
MRSARPGAIEDFRFRISEKLGISETQELAGTHALGGDWRFQVADFRAMADCGGERGGPTISDSRFQRRQIPEVKEVRRTRGAARTRPGGRFEIPDCRFQSDGRLQM